MPQDPPPGEAPRLPLVLGVTGHRDPMDPEGLRTELRRLFRELREAAPHTPVILLSPLAAGCDQIFAEVGLDALADGPGVELFVPMPFELDDYRRDFDDDAEGLAAFEGLRSRASACFALPPRSVDDLVDWTAPDGTVVRRVLAPAREGGVGARDIHYDRLGRFIAVQSHLVFALWNGREAEVRNGVPQQLGGTASVVRYCRDGDGHRAGRGVPLREELSSLGVVRRVPLAVVPCRRRRDPATAEPSPVFEGVSGPQERGDSGLRRALRLGALPGREMGDGHGMGSASEAKASSPDVVRPNDVVSMFLQGLRDIDRCNDDSRWHAPIRAAAEVGPGAEAERLDGVRGAVGALERGFRVATERTVVALAGLLRPVGRDHSGQGRRRSFSPSLGEVIGLFWPPDMKAHISDQLESEAERADCAPLESVGRRALVGIFRRMDRLANAEAIRHRRSGALAVGLLLVALVSFQVFGSFSGDLARMSIFGYLLALVGYLAWARRIKECEEQRALTRCFAEIARVQLSWRVAGIRRSVADHLLSRRRSLLGRLDFLLGSLDLVAILPASAESGGDRGDSSGLRAVRVGWIDDQRWYCGSGRSMLRKRGKVQRRVRRLRRMKRVVVAVAVSVALLVLLSQLVVGDDGAPSLSWLVGDAAFSLLEFVIGMSLVLVLMTEFRSSISLDSEDAEAAANALALFDAAAVQLDRRMERGDFDGARRIVRDLGENIVDEQVEWYVKHRDSAAVDAVG